MHKIVLSEQAYLDLDSMFSYIASDNKDAANQLLERIYSAIKQLGENPELGVALGENEAYGVRRGYRRIIINPYMVFYRVVDQRIIVARILHCKRNWIKALFE